MNIQRIELLVVDDEMFNREILQELLGNAGYNVAQAADGEEAWQMLETEQHHFSAILLDRIMPRLDGMGLLARMKGDTRFAKIPVIFQTAIDSPMDIAEGIKAGAFYYLVKPVDKNGLLAIVHSAVKPFHMADNVRVAASPAHSDLASMLLNSEFKLSTLHEARTLASALSSFYPQPQRVLLGIAELLINAVEHGNLGISYQDKSRLLQEGKWEAEIERRLALPEHAAKKVEVRLEQNSHEISLFISDCGAGFDNREYMEMSPERAFDPNGRGIAMSKMLSFDSIEYQGNGNNLIAVLKL